MKVKRACTTFVLLYFLHLKVSEIHGDELDPSKDYMLNFTEIAKKIGLKYEVQDVITEDKYILQLFHLPGNSSRPVFLLSGNMGSADDYIARGSTSLAAVLVGAGYDVWVGNWRGCRYGRRHLTLDPDRDEDFWNFSYHEYAKYDVPALIDHVLNETQTNRLAGIAWSLGTTAFFVMGALRPEYVDKVAVLIALGPFGYMYHSVPLTATLPVYPILVTVAKIFDLQELGNDNSTFMTIFRYVCCSKEFSYEICAKVLLFPEMGIDDSNLEPEFAPMVFGHYPAGTSSKSQFHTHQGLIGHRIAYYDYGPTQNLVKYGSVVAPDYPLHKNNMTIVLISGMNDLVSTLADVELLKKRLPNVVDHIILEPPEFNHLDFCYGKDSHKLLYEKHILRILKKYYS